METGKLVNHNNRKQLRSLAFYYPSYVNFGFASPTIGKNNFVLHGNIAKCRDQVLTGMGRGIFGTDQCSSWKNFSVNKQPHIFVGFIKKTKNEAADQLIEDVKLYLHKIEDHFGLERTEVLRVAYERTTKSVKNINKHGFIFKPDKRLMNSMNTLSLYLLLIRIGTNNKVVREYKSIDSILDKFRSGNASVSDIGYLSGKYFKVWTTLLANIDDIFDGITRRYMYSIKRVQDHHSSYYKGMYNRLSHDIPEPGKRSLINNMASGIGCDGIHQFNNGMSLQKKVLKRLKSHY